MEQLTGVIAQFAMLPISIFPFLAPALSGKVSNKIEQLKEKASNLKYSEEMRAANKVKLDKYIKRFGWISKPSFVIGANLGTIGLTFLSVIGFQIWGNSKQKEASRIGRFQAKQTDLKNVKNFVTYTPEQMEEAKKLAEKIPDKKDKNKLSKMISELRAMSRDKKAYKEWLKNKDPQEIEKIKSQHFTKEELEKAKEDQELITTVVKEINNKAEDYSENLENVFDTLNVFDMVIAAPVGFAINKLLKLCNVKLSPIRRKFVSAAIPVFTMIGGAMWGTILQKDAARVGRYVARKDLVEHPEILTSYSDEDMKKAENIKAPDSKRGLWKKLTESFSFLKTFINEKKEYDNYKKTEKKEKDKIRQSFEKIEITEQQKKEAQALQKNVFRAFEEVDEMSQRYSEDTEAACEIGKQLGTGIYSAAATAAAILPLILTMKGKFPIAKIVNTLSNVALKKDSTLRKAINEFYGELKVDKRLRREFHLAITSGEVEAFINKNSNPAIREKGANLLFELRNTFGSNSEKVLQAKTIRERIEAALDGHFKDGFFAKWIRRNSIEGKLLWERMKADDEAVIELMKQQGLNDWHQYKSLIQTGAVLGVPLLGLIVGIPYTFNAWLTNIQKKAGRIGVMKAMERIDDPRVFATKTQPGEEKNTPETSKTQANQPTTARSSNLLKNLKVQTQKV